MAAKRITVDLDGKLVALTRPEVRELRRIARAGSLELRQVDVRLGGRLARKGLTAVERHDRTGWCDSTTTVTELGRQVLARVA